MKYLFALICVSFLTATVEAQQFVIRPPVNYARGPVVASGRPIIVNRPNIYGPGFNSFNYGYNYNYNYNYSYNYSYGFGLANPYYSPYNDPQLQAYLRWRFLTYGY